MLWLGAFQFVLVVALTIQPVEAQQVSLGAGYTEMPGRIGDSQSEHGLLVRLGVDLRSGERFTWGLEGAIERLNEARNQTTSSCIVPGGGTGTCRLDRRSRDTGWSLGTTLRISANDAPVRPYALVGLGLLTVRTWEQQVVTDAQGGALPNFSYEGTSSDAALQGHLGAGVTTRPASWPVGLYAEGRVTRLIHNYSGGLVANWNPTLVVGVRR
jgi:hypothetical protein